MLPSNIKSRSLLRSVAVLCILIISVLTKGISVHGNEVRNFEVSPANQSDSRTLEFPQQGFEIQIPTAWESRTSNSFGPHLPPDTVTLGISSYSFDVTIVSVNLTSDFPKNPKEFAYAILGKFKADPRYSDIVFTSSESQMTNSTRAILHEPTTEDQVWVTVVSEFIILSDRGYWLSTAFYSPMDTFLPSNPIGQDRLKAFNQVVRSFITLQESPTIETTISYQDFQKVSDLSTEEQFLNLNTQALFTWPTTGYIGWIYGRDGHNGVDYWTSEACNGNSTEKGNAVYSPYSGYLDHLYQIPGGAYDGVRIWHGTIGSEEIWSHYWHLGSYDPNTHEQTSFIVVGTGSVNEQTLIGYQGNLKRVNNTTATTTCVHLHHTVANGNKDRDDIDPSPYFDAHLNWIDEEHVPWHYYVEHPGGCQNAAAVGANSSRQQMFIDAYNRNNGDVNLGCTENIVGWWGTEPNRVTRQDFTVSDTYGDAVIVHDEDNEAATPNTIPAYVVHGGILGNYLESGNLVNYGPATSDEFTNQQGVPQSNFGRGYVTWEGNAVWHPWPTNFSGWKAEYYNYDFNANDSDNTPTVDYPTIVRNENVDKPDYDWGEGAPEGGHIGVFADKFSVRWTRTVNFSTAGLYRFSTHSDDGVRVWIDNTLIIDHWMDGGDQNYTGDINLSAGNHVVKIEYYENGGFAYFSIDWTLSDTTPPTKASNVRPNGWTGPYTEDTTPFFRWDAATDGGSGLAGYYVAVDDRTPDGSGGNDWWVGNVTSYNVPNALPEGQHRFAVTSKDNAGNVNPVNGGPDAPYYTFYVDIAPPSTPQLTISGAGCSGNLNNVWQNTCREPVFSWSSSDSVSGVKDYCYYWGTLSSGSPDTTTTETSFSPTAIAPLDGFGSYYLNITARDELNHESGRSSFGVRYDGAPPTATLTINNGSATTQQVDVRLNINAGDIGSGVKQMRFSNNGLDWTPWEPYDTVKSWTLLAQNRREHGVYTQIRDRAGNETPIVSDTITLDLYPLMPHSASYRICDDVVNVGGSIGLTSTNFTLASAIGQPWVTGASANNSTSYLEHSGFLAATTGCRPITRSVTSNYTVTQWVIAAGGALRGSTNFRLGDTAGQPAASGTRAFTSTSYTLSSGFWAQITGTVPSTSTIVPTPPPPTPTPTPTPGPMPTPQPGSFGVSINGGALYTNDPEVLVETWAPDVTYVRLSNDGGYADDNWRSYQLAHTWTISTYGTYVMPRTVYAWFKDAQSALYGPYQDTIIYDPIAPQGSVQIVGTMTAQSTAPTPLKATSIVTLNLEASDDNSGVASMRLGESTLENVTWQPFTSTVTETLQGDVIYAQFRDNAGNISSLFGSDGSVHALESRPLSVTLSGPTIGLTGTTYTFNANVQPITATVPITYVWQVTQHDPVTHTASLQAQDTLSLTWSMTGTQVLTVTAMNSFGVATGTHVITLVGRTPTCPVPLTDVAIQHSGEISSTFYVDTLYYFTTIPNPVDATLPITYTWTPTPYNGQETSVIYQWSEPGTYTITLEAENCAAVPRQAHYVVEVQDIEYPVYLPMVLKQ